MNGQHGADAALGTEARIAIVLMDLFLDDEAIAELAQKRRVRVCGDERSNHRRAVLAEIVEHGFQRFEFGARQNAVKPLWFGFRVHGLVRHRPDGCRVFDHKIWSETVP